MIINDLLPLKSLDETIGVIGVQYDFTKESIIE